MRAGDAKPILFLGHASCAEHFTLLFHRPTHPLPPQVSNTAAPDYSKFVPAAKAMWLDRIHKRTGAAVYASVEDFRKVSGAPEKGSGPCC